MNILDKIISNKYKEVYIDSNNTPIKKLEKSKLFERKCFSLKKKLKESSSGIISEFKRRSPSKGILNKNINIISVAKDYESAGASGISILTDKKFFYAEKNDLFLARQNTSIPILKKDFIIDIYQIFLAKSMGADVILLIAEILSKKMINEFAKQAKNIGMEVIMELHSENEIYKINDNIDIIGINNRDLKTFKVNIESSIQLFSKIPDEFIKISESGISTPKDIFYLKNVGFKGFLIGEIFMISNNPGYSCKNFIKNINNYLKLNCE